MEGGQKNAQQIRETSQAFLVSNTLFKTVATRANWPTHRRPAMRSDTPIPNLNTVEMPMSKRTKLREIATFIHVSSLLAIGRGGGRGRITGKNHIEDLKLWVLCQWYPNIDVWEIIFLIKLNSSASTSRNFEILVSCRQPRGSFTILLLYCKVFAALGLRVSKGVQPIMTPSSSPPWKIRKLPSSKAMLVRVVHAP